MMWPNETRSYRDKRNVLLEKEASLRTMVEEVAELRRALPNGGRPPQDYEFQRAADNQPVRLSQMFAPGQDTLFAYSFMYRPGGDPCPMCTAMLDGLDKTVSHLRQRLSVAIIAKAEVDDLTQYADKRGWDHLPLYSSAGNSYNLDYRAENEKGEQTPVVHVWRRHDGEIRHFWASELFFRNDPDWPHQPRHADMFWPLWNVLDLSPEGRGNWFPSL